MRIMGHRLTLASLALASVLLAAACADAPRIWFENQRDEDVYVSIDGDRLLILGPHSGQYLPYSTAAWAWPRRIDMVTRSGVHLPSDELDADGLARNHFILYAR